MRVHNSHLLFPRLFDRRQIAFTRKPAGLWWSSGSAWTDLLSGGTSPATGGRQAGAHDHEVILGPAFRLLTIATIEDALVLSRRHAQPMPHARDGFFWQVGDRSRYDPGQDDELASHGRARAFLMDWPAIAEDFDGIEITMPVGGARGDRVAIEWLDTDWDILSGCAWRTSEIDLRKIPDLHATGPGAGEDGPEC